MFGPCPVVRIVYDNPEGFCEINAEDYDSEKHKLYAEPEAESAPPKAEAKADAPKGDGKKQVKKQKD